MSLSQSEFPKRAALVAAISLLLMTALGPFGLLTLEGHLANGATSENLTAISSGSTFVWVVYAFLAIALLDLAAAWGLHVVFRDSDVRLSLISAILRAVYGVALAVLALLYLQPAPGLAIVSADPALQSISKFMDGWRISLGVFGLHLIVLGVIGFKALNFHSFLAALVVLAGVGYVVDAVGPALVNDYALNAAAYVFFGELLLMIWLFYRAWRG